MRNHAHTFAYRIVSVIEGGRPTPHAEIRCRCGTRITRRLLQTNMPPERIARLFRRDGWELEPTKPNSARCPVCQQAAKDRAAGERPRKESEEVSTTTPNNNSAPRKLTPDEKQRVRTLLDGNFDEAKGVYLGGYSDQRIASECNVPWASVRELRDFAYAPLRSIPELEPLQAESHRILADAKKLESEGAALVKRAEELDKRITEATRKLGVAA